MNFFSLIKFGLKINCFIILLFLYSCNNKQNNESTKTVIQNEFAQGFSIETFIDYKKISVFDPWQNAESEKFEYYLIKNEQKTPDFFTNEQVIKIPVEKIICLSTTHLGYIEKLDKRGTIVGISETKFVYDSIIQSYIEKGTIQEVGYEQSMNVEKIISLKPDVVFAYDINGGQYNMYTQLENFGIPVVFVGEYLENEPLGKAEWIKFFAAFFSEDSLGNQYFEEIKQEYINLQKSVKNNKQDKPGVLVNTPFQGIWYLPGGNSYFSKIIDDAGGNYLWKNNKSNESFSISLEDIYTLNDSIDILLNPGMYNSISDITKSDTRLKNLYCIVNQKVYNNNKRINKYGGNDFWESGTVNPHLILKDLIIIFDEKQNGELYYYQKIQK